MNVLTLGGPLHRQGIDTGDDPIQYYRHPIWEPRELSSRYDDCRFIEKIKTFDYMLIRLFDGTPVYVPCDLDISEMKNRLVRPLNDEHRRNLAIDTLAKIAIEYNNVKGYAT